MQDEMRLHPEISAGYLEEYQEKFKKFVSLSRLQPAFLCAIVPIVPRSAYLAETIDKMRRNI